MSRRKGDPKISPKVSNQPEWIDTSFVVFPQLCLWKLHPTVLAALSFGAARVRRGRGVVCG